MGICWWCYWGWPKAVKDVYDVAMEELLDMGSDWTPLRFGPSHVVWEDENFDDDTIRHCIGRCDNPEPWDGTTPEERAVVKKSLEALLAIPEGVRCEPDDYDEEHPDQYPPAPCQLPMVK